MPDKLEYFDEVRLPAAGQSCGIPTTGTAAVHGCHSGAPNLPSLSPFLPIQITYRPELLPAAGPFELQIHSVAPFLGDKVGRRAGWVEGCGWRCWCSSLHALSAVCAVAR